MRLSDKDFYEKVLPKSSMMLEGSKPGVYKNMLRITRK